MKQERPVCPKCEGKMELARYSRGNPEEIALGDKRAEHPRLEYDCLDEECSGNVTLRHHFEVQ